MAGKPIKITLLADNSNALRGINAVASRLGILSKVSQAAGRALARGVRIGFLATAAGAVLVTKKIYDTYTAVQRTGVAFGFLFQEAGGAATAMASIRDIASNSPFPVDQLAIYTKQLAGAGNSAAEADKKLRIILDTTAAFGSTQEQTGRAILALTQIQSKATVQSEELNQLAEAGIPAYIALSKATGKSVPELRKLGQQGKLLSADVLPVLYAQLQKDYGGALVKQSETLSGRLNTLKNRTLFLLADAFTPLFEALNRALPGIIDGVTRIIPKLGDELAKLPGFLSKSTAAVNKWASDFNAAVERVTGSSVGGNIGKLLAGGKTVLTISFKLLGNDVAQKALATLALIVLQWKAIDSAIRTATAAQAIFFGVAKKGPTLGITAVIAAATVGFINFKNAGYDTATSIKLVATTAVEWLGRFGAALLGAGAFVAVFVGNLAAGGIRAAIDKFIIQPLRDAALQFADLFDKLPGKIKPQGLINSLRSFGNQAGFGFGDALNTATERGKAAFDAQVNRIPLDTNKALLGLPTVGAQAGAKTGAALALGIEQKVPVAIAAARKTSLAVGQNLAATQDPAQRAGERSSAAFSGGVKAGSSAAGASGRAVGSQAVSGAQSASKPMSSTGSQAGSSFAGGVGSARGAAAGAGASLASAAYNAARSGIGNFFSIGAFAAQGLAGGILANVGAAAAAAARLAEIANQAARAKAKIQSPSKVFEEIGRFMVLGLIEGLTKDRDSLKSVATSLATLLSDTAKNVAQERADLFSKATDQRKTLIDAQRELGLLRREKVTGKTAKERAANAAELAKKIKAAEHAVDVASKGYLAAIKKVADFDKNAAVKAISDPKTRAAAQRLIADFAKRMDAVLAQRDDVAARLEDANQKLADAISVRDEFAKALKESALSFASLSSLVFEDAEGNKVDPTAGGIQAQLQARLDAIKNFTAQVEQLAAAGLGKDLLQQILEMGPETGSVFAKAVLEGGAEGIASLNGLQTQINGASDRLASFGSQTLFQAGVASAQGLVDGLLAQQKQLEDTATKMAQAFAAQFKRMLGIPAAQLLPIEQLFNTLPVGTQTNPPIVRPTATGSASTTGSLTVKLQGGNARDLETARDTILQLQQWSQVNGPLPLNVTVST